MNAAHFHLFTLHAPLVLIPVSAVLWAWSMTAKGAQTRSVARVLAILAGLSAWLPYLSGEGAEDLVKELPGFESARVHEHEDAALFALISAQLVAAAALAETYLFKNRRKAAAIAVLVIAILSSTVFMRTGYLGGLISHPEVR